MISQDDRDESRTRRGRRQRIAVALCAAATMAWYAYTAAASDDPPSSASGAQAAAQQPVSPTRADAPTPAKHYFVKQGAGKIYPRDLVHTEDKLTGIMTDGRYTLLDEVWKPGFAVVPHFHAEHSETFYILTGQVDWTVDGETQRLGPGELVYIPPDTVHAVKVVGNQDVRTLMIYDPGGYEAHLDEEQEYTPEQRQQPDVMKVLRAHADFNLAPMPDARKRPTSGPTKGWHVFSKLRAGETFKPENEISEVKLSAVQTDGRYSFLDEIWKPGMSVPPHFHARHSETFYIVAGQVEWTVGGETQLLGPGDLVYIPPDTVHSVKVVGNKDVQSLMLYEPGGYEYHSRREAEYTPEQRKQPEILRKLREQNDFNPVGTPPASTTQPATRPSAAAAPAGGLDASRHWDEALLSQPTFKVRMEHNVQVPMRDGVMLSTDLYIPDAPGRYPALIWRTPYSNNSAGNVEQSKWYASRGYVVVQQDVRGKYDSGGESYTFKHEANDGYDTDEWIGRQPWSNGKIGAMGGSYLGYTEITQAIRGSRFLTTMAASVTTSDIYNNWVYVDGALFLGFAFPWGAVAMDGHVMQYTQAYDWPTVFKHLPIATADQAASHVNQAYRDWVKHPTRDAYWKDISFEDEIDRITVPFLVVEGWYDIFLRGALRDDIAIRKRGSEATRRGKRLVIGPWTHETGQRTSMPPGSAGADRGIDFGEDAQIEMRKIYLRWNDYWLKGIDNGVATEPPVKIFVMGENRWRYEQEWPLARTQYTKYHLRSGGRANSLRGDGALGAAPPSGVETDTFTYDPTSPVPSLGGNTCCSTVPSGARDQRAAEERDDVLVYTGEVLREAVEVTGPLSMTLFASTSAKDTDWTAKLVDVHPDGYSQNIQDGILRARYRNAIGKPGTLLEPGRVYEYTIDMWATSHVFLPGHRIRLEVSSSNFPRFDRNLNTGEEPGTATRMEKAQQTIYHSTRYPSHVVLPIIPRPAGSR